MATSSSSWRRTARPPSGTVAAEAVLLAERYGYEGMGSALDDRPDGTRAPGRPARVAHARARLPRGDDAARLTSVLSLMADPTRARVLFALDVVEELCVGDPALALETNEDAAATPSGCCAPRAWGPTAGGTGVFYRLADGFPEPLREHCLRRLIVLAEASAPEDD